MTLKYRVVLETLDDLSAWLNCWADMNEHGPHTVEWEQGYRQAVKDTFRHIRPLQRHIEKQKAKRKDGVK